jgi:hypothetical protein
MIRRRLRNLALGQALLRSSERDGKADSCHATPRVAQTSNVLSGIAGIFYGRYWARTSDPQLVELVLSQLS